MQSVRNVCMYTYSTRHWHTQTVKPVLALQTQTRAHTSSKTLSASLAGQRNGACFALSISSLPYTHTYRHTHSGPSTRGHRTHSGRLVPARHARGHSRRASSARLAARTGWPSPPSTEAILLHLAGSRATRTHTNARGVELGDCSDASLIQCVPVRSLRLEMKRTLSDRRIN